MPDNANHELKTHISDNTTSLWITCSCGFETSFYTIIADGVAAMEAANEEAQQHVNPRPLSIDRALEDIEFPPNVEGEG
jgi:hypothetical protein